MVIYLDYYMENKEDGITNIAVREDSLTHFYRRTSVEKILQFMGGRELIVVFEKPYGRLKDALQGYDHYLEDYNVRKRWVDLFVEVRNSSGYAVTLGKIAKSTLGEDEFQGITRLEPEIEGQHRNDVGDQMRERLSALQRVFEYAIRFHQVSFERGDQTLWAELNINENIIDED